MGGIQLHEVSSYVRWPVMRGIQLYEVSSNWRHRVM